MAWEGSSTTARVSQSTNACRVTITFNNCDDSKVGNSKRCYYIYRSYLDLGFFFCLFTVFYWINCEKTQFRGTFLRCSENSRWTRNETTKLQESMFSCDTYCWIESFLGRFVYWMYGSHLLISCSPLEIMYGSLKFWNWEMTSFSCLFIVLVELTLS